MGFSDTVFSPVLSTGGADGTGDSYIFQVPLGNPFTFVSALGQELACPVQMSLSLSPAAGFPFSRLAQHRFSSDEKKPSR